MKSLAIDVQRYELEIPAMTNEEHQRVLELKRLESSH